MSKSIKEQLTEMDVSVKLAPLPNGKYKLPDNTILKVKDNMYEHIGHRDKKTQRKLLRQTEEELMGLLTIPGYGGHKREKLEKMKKIELANMLNPKPKCYFAYCWVENATSSKAKRIASLMKKAVPLEAKRYKTGRKSK
jgi:hypothetical protein